ncbi:HupE/UreJ family protein [Polaromonas aquatica]|uniref:HupE/UreJ family protein n=1 Tax=Polaromonas aquatica TaxID=332657 RepID=UPI003D65D4C0
MPTKTKTALFLIAACALSTRASAHIDHDFGAAVHGHAGALLSGALHPLTGMDHLAAMVAVGLWSALAARRAGPGLLWGPLGFAGMLLVGALLGLQGVHIPAVEPMIAASLLVTGLLVVTRWQVTGIAAAVIVGAFALFHGLAHGHELAGAPSTWATLSGMLAATLLLHLAGLGAGWALRSANVWLPRAAGAAVAAFGVTLLAQLA